MTDVIPLPPERFPTIYESATDEELKEAVSQIDKSNDGEFSFEELWTWWIQDKL